MKLLQTAILAVALLGSSVAASQEQRLTVSLDWRHLPRTQHDLDVLMEATVPSARIVFQRWSSGKQAFTIDFVDGQSCASLTVKDIPLTLKCGTKSGYYWLTKVPKNNARLEWVFPAFLPDTQH